MPIGIGIAVGPHDAFYWPWYPEPPDTETISKIWSVLTNPKIKKTFHNCMFDLIALQLISDVDTSNIADTNVMAHLLGYQNTALTDIAVEIGREATSAKAMLGPGQTMLNLDEHDVAQKCCNDASVCLDLYNRFIDKVDKSSLDVDMRVVPVLMKMSNRGLRIDHIVREELETKLTEEVAHFKELADGLGFSPSSPNQVAYILAKRGNWLPYTKSKKGLSTSEGVLELLEDPIASLVLVFRKSFKLLNTYVLPLKHEDRIYTRYNLDARTGRISSSDRAMQNIPPGRPRNMYVPDSGTFTDADYSQQELRILSYESQDRNLLRTFDLGNDVHEVTATLMGIPRRKAKNVNFAMIYGATPETLRETAKIKDLRTCSGLIDKWFRAYPSAAEWIKWRQEETLRTGWTQTLFGRRMRLSLDTESEDGIRRKAVNYAIQGAGADIMKRALIMCSHMPLTLTVHDSMMFDGDVEKELRAMPELEHIAPIFTPLEIKTLLAWE